MALKQLRLKVDSYEQFDPSIIGKAAIKHPLQLPADQRTYRHFTRGELITPRDEQEQQRLLDKGIAEDPQAVHERRRQELEQRKQQLADEEAALEEQRKAAQAEQRAEKSGSK